MEVTLHLDAYKAISETTRKFTEQDSFAYKHLASRLVLPVLNAMVGVAYIFQQLTRAIASLLNLDFSKAAKDLGGVIVQSVALPFIVAGSLIAPGKTADYLVKTRRFHTRFENADNYNRVSNFAVSFLQVPSRILTTTVMATVDILAPGRPTTAFRYTETKARWNSFKEIVTTPITAPLDSVYHAVGGLFSSAIRAEAAKVLVG